MSLRTSAIPTVRTDVQPPATIPKRIEFLRPRCPNPACRSTKLYTRSTRKQRNGDLHRYTMCTSCGWSGLVIAK
jgi:hypothetical protein